MTPADTGIGFGIVGCGVIAPTHAEAIAANGARLVATYDEVPERAAALASAHGAHAAASLDELLADPAVDVVTVCTPSGMHADTAVPAARAGRHLLVEKPLDVTLGRARAIVRAAEEAGTVLSVVSQHHFDDATIAAKRAIESGELGRIVLAQAEVLWYRAQAYYDADAWRGTRRLDGGGALMNQGIHSVDLLRYLAGDVEHLWADAARLGHDGIEVEDVAVAALRFRSGALGVLSATTAAGPGFETRIEIYGDRGAVRIAADRLAWIGSAPASTLPRPPGGPGGETAFAPAGPGDETALAPDGPGDETVRVAARAMEQGAASRPEALASEGHVRQVADLLDAIREHRPPAVTGEDGVRALELVLAVYEAARSGTGVVLPLEGHEQASDLRGHAGLPPRGAGA